MEKENTSKKKARYVFWARHSNDIDHVAPIVYGLLENGVPDDQIRYIALSPEKYIMPGKDNQLKFLKSKGVEFEMPHTSEWYLALLYRFAKIQPKNFFEWFVRRITRAVYYRIFIGKDHFKWPNWHYALNVLEETPPGSVFIFDHKDSLMYKKLVGLAQKKKITCVSAPHGLIVFYELPGGEEIKSNAKGGGREHPLSFYDLVIMPNRFSAEKYEKLGLSKNKMRVLGSARFCPEWMKVMEKIYPMPSEFSDIKGKINVVFLLEKGANRFNEVSNVDEQVKTIDFLRNEQGVEIIIKLNPRSISKEQENYLQTVDCLQFDAEYTTQELVAWADVIVAGATSVIFDPLSRGKVVIIMDYVQPVTLVYHEYHAPIIAGSIDEFGKWIKKIKANPSYSYYREQDTKRLLGDFIYADENEKNVLGTYSRFLTGLCTADCQIQNQVN